MGKHQILQNCSLSLRLNFIFEITNEIGQHLCHKCCFFCSNSVIKSLFIRLNQPVHMRSPERALTVSIATRTPNGSCSDVLTLPIRDWLFHSESGASCDWAAILSVAFFPIQNYTSDMSWVFYSLCYRWAEAVLSSRMVQNYSWMLCRSNTQLQEALAWGYCCQRWFIKLCIFNGCVQ